ncbi:MAG: dihydroorotase [Thermoprotei archaeon]|nr:MAG: dihydroorotase [Thermoprotei archaeon]
MRIPERDVYTIHGRAYVLGGIRRVSIVISGEFIKRMCLGYTCREGDVVKLNEPGTVVLPGVIDMHVHLRGLELSYKEDEKSGTMAAAAGGVTLVLDMPNTKPRINTTEALERKLEALRTKSYVEFGVYVGLNPRKEELEKMLANKHVAGLKLYPEDLPLIDEGIMELVAKNNKLLIVHCEHPDLIEEGCHEGERSLCRPVAAELGCLESYSQLFRRARTHITHVTSPQLLLKARAEGFTTDTCPHYLLLTSDYERKLGCIAKVNPPLRPRDVQEKLFNLFVAGLVDAWVTDHAPHSHNEKLKSFVECPSGFPGLEISLKILLTLVNKGFISMKTVTRLTNSAPRKILKIDNYGCTEPGCVASLTIVNLKKRGRIDPTKFISKAKYTPFEGFEYEGDVIATIVRGSFVYVEGDFYNRPMVGNVEFR